MAQELYASRLSASRRTRLSEAGFYYHFEALTEKCLPKVTGIQ